MLAETKKLIADQDVIRKWLERINETDEVIINETITLMRTNPEYRKFILDYAKTKENEK